ncbi:MAG: phosphodiester glycosidase family protein [Ruminococcaceae bacterium]|nr:phosphodiester glycosidase family protein [Oscillospiraceae bacterium]
MEHRGSSSLWKVLAVDLIVAVFVLLNFAYYHHVRTPERDPGAASESIVVIEKPQYDVRFSFDVVGFENSSLVMLNISALTDKEITASTFCIDYDTSKLTYKSTEAGSGLHCDLINVREKDGTLTVSADIDADTPYLFVRTDAVSGSDAAQAETALSIAFECSDPQGAGIEDFSLSVNPARLLTTDNQLATFTLLNGSSVLDSSGDFRVKFPDKFTDGEVIETENSYMSANVNVTYYTKTVDLGKNKTLCHVIDIYVRSYDYFRTAIYEDRIDGGYNQRIKPLTLAKQNNAIAAINGDYCTARSKGIVVRNGILYRTEPFQDILVMYADGSMKTFEEGTYNGIDFSKENVWQIWSFGPALLTDDGQTKTEFNSVVCKANPRSAIGYFEPGHYCLVTADGRGEGGSVGLTMSELSQLFYDLGCTAAYNLDGGKTSVSVWGDRVINNPYDGGRASSDIVYIPRDQVLE